MAATSYFVYKPPELLLELCGVFAACVLLAGFSVFCFCSLRIASAKPWEKNISLYKSLVYQNKAYIGVVP